MSRSAASFSLTVTRGSTWEDEFLYVDEDGQPYDLTDFDARMQVRLPDGRYGTSTSATLVMELTTANGRLIIDTPDGGTVPNRVRIVVDAADTSDLNPLNDRRARLVYGVELVRDDYILPLVNGNITVLGEVVR